MTDWIPPDDPEGANRRRALEAFADITTLPDIRRLVQRGRDPSSARLSIELVDGRTIVIGTIDKLLSRAKLDTILAVTAGAITVPTKPDDWRDCVRELIEHAIDIEETPDERLTAQLIDWLDQYARGAHTDRDGAIAQREPFTSDGELWVSAEHLGRWLKREYSETIPAADIRHALRDLGFVSARVSYNASGAGKNRKRTSAGYYHGPLDILGEGEPGDVVALQERRSA